MKLTQKQETFCIKYFELGNASEAALIAGYSPKYAATHTTRWLNMANIKERIQELRQKAEDVSVANAVERRQRLTQFLREDNYSKFGINRQSNIQASDQLNKMDKLYTDGAILNKVEINIGDPKEKLLSLISRLATRAGEAGGDTVTKSEGS